MLDPDLEIRGGGGVVSKKDFSSLWASVWTKNKGGGGGGGPGPSRGSATVYDSDTSQFLNQYLKSRLQFSQVTLVIAHVYWLVDPTLIQF